MKYNIIGFSNSVTPKGRQCVIHPGVSLIQNIQEPDTLFCPMCGTSYLNRDTAATEEYSSKFGPQSTKILTAKKKKKYYDQQGNEITDKDIMQLAQEGKTIVHYSEIKPSGDSAFNSKYQKLPRKSK